MNENEFYNNLAIVGIVGQACEDYLTAKRLLHLEKEIYLNSREDRVRAAKRLLSDCKRFFKSDWYKHLCSFPGEEMMAKLDVEFEARKANNFEKIKLA